MGGVKDPTCLTWLMVLLPPWKHFVLLKEVPIFPLGADIWENFGNQKPKPKKAEISHD